MKSSSVVRKNCRGQAFDRTSVLGPKSHCVTPWKWRTWRSKEYIDIWHRDTEFGVCLARFWSSCETVFPHYDPVLPFRTVVYILCYIMLEIHDLLFYFDFTEVTDKGLPWVSEDTLEFKSSFRNERLRGHLNLDRQSFTLWHGYGPLGNIESKVVV